MLNDRVCVNLGGINTQRNDNDTEVQNLYNSCSYKICYTLSDGLLTRCARSPTGHLNNLYPFCQKDHINVRVDSDTLKQRLKLFMADPHFMEACRYCNGGDARFIGVGEQI